MMKIFTKIKKHYGRIKKLNNYDTLDKINLFHNEIILAIGLVFIYFYLHKHFSTIRNALSDTISFSSIIMGVLGVLIGILIALDSSSSFFKKAEQYNKKQMFYSGLMHQTKRAFITNIIFVSVTVIFNIVPPIENWFLKGIILLLWGYLFIKIIWQICYLIIVMVNVATYEEPKKEKEKKRS